MTFKIVNLLVFKIKMDPWRGRLKSQSIKASVVHALQSLCDLSATKIYNDRRGRRGVATRFGSWSATRRRLIGDWLPTDRPTTSWGPLCDLMQLVVDWSRTGPRLIVDQSPIGHRPSQLKIVIKKKKTLIISFQTDELNSVNIVSYINYVYMKNKCLQLLYNIVSEYWHKFTIMVCEINQSRDLKKRTENQF